VVATDAAGKDAPPVKVHHIDHAPGIASFEVLVPVSRAWRLDFPLGVRSRNPWNRLDLIPEEPILEARRSAVATAPCPLARPSDRSRYRLRPRLRFRARPVTHDWSRHNAAPRRVCRVMGSYAFRQALHTRSEERRVGKECRSRWSP